LLGSKSDAPKKNILRKCSVVYARFVNSCGLISDALWKTIQLFMPDSVNLWLLDFVADTLW